ncbi:pentapeptide repeat-containing protein [candidate division KSB1 bacterium]|nr:pentapeptide repeat-containing protein [candidate division KSB1 bacterium]
MKKTLSLKEEKCPVCVAQAYEWAIRPRIWNSEKCWNHMRQVEKEKWIDQFKAQLSEHKSLRSQKIEMKYLRDVYLEKYYKVFKDEYLKNQWKLKQYKHKKDIPRHDDFDRELTEDEKAYIVNELYKRYIYDLNRDEKGYNFIGINFASFDFRDCDLSNANFSEANLRGANFENSILRDTIISSVVADEANFTNADMSFASVVNTKLNKSCFFKTVIQSCNFSNSILIDADFRESRGSTPKFTSCDISQASFVASRLPEANFEKTKLNKAAFDGAQLLKANFEGCEARQTIFRQCNLEEANLSRSNFENAVFKDSNLAGANTCDTILKQADLSNADMTGCKMNEGTTLEYSDLRGSNLKKVDLYLAKLEETKAYYEDIDKANLLTNQLKGNHFLMERKEKTKIFISYSHADAVFAHKLENALLDNSIDVWIDRKEILVGDSLIDKIREGIDSSQYVCAILSNTSVESRWVQNELDLAMNDQIENQKVKVLPLVINKDVELPGFLKGKLYIDFSNEEHFAICVSQILRRVNS